MRYSVRQKRRRWPRRIFVLLVVALLVLVVGTIVAQKLYQNYLNPVNSSDQSNKLIAISTGSSVDSIASMLQAQGLIRSAWAFELYVSAEQDRGVLKAGTYRFSPSESTQEIVSEISHGKIATNLVTILPGQRLDQVEQTLENDGYSQAQVMTGLNPSNYPISAFPVMSIKPAGASLEGLLYPDSFQKATTTSVEQIVGESLNEMNQRLNSEVRADFSNEQLSTYQALIIASMVEQEVSTQSDRNQVAQVFISRLHAGMTLGSNVTAYYGAILAGVNPSVSYDSPYNTLLHAGLPPTPISTISSSSIAAVSEPANTSWLYFVTGDNGITYFSKTLAQHEQLIAQYCHKMCSQ